MKLNPDCIRDILLSIEEISAANSLLTSTQLQKSRFLSHYSTEEVIYHLKQLKFSGYIITPEKSLLDKDLFLVCDLSPIGHEFLSNIRKDTNWNKVKSICSEVGSETLTSIKTIAENVISSAIATFIGLS